VDFRGKVTEKTEGGYVKYSEVEMCIPPFLKWVSTRGKGGSESCRKVFFERPSVFLHDLLLIERHEESVREGVLPSATRVRSSSQRRGGQFGNIEFHKTVQMC